VDGAGRVAAPRVQVVAIFDANRANDGFPTQASADGEEAGIKRIICDRAGEAEVVGEGDDRPFGSEGLLEFDGTEGIGFGADKLSEFVAGRSFAFLIAADGILASGEVALVKRELFGGAADGSDESVAQADANEAPALEWMMPGSPHVPALVVDVAGEVFGSEFEGAENLIAPAGIERVIAAIMFKLADDGADAAIGESLGLSGAAEVRGAKDLVIIADTEVSGNRPEVFVESDTAAVFLTREGDFFPAQACAVEEKVDVIADQFGDSVSEIGAGGFE